ncbi:MAG: hypothetical protein LBH68_00660 [Bifidobacteriaceae bacterium]|jgi:signal transduction histidine kinase|nr:hypothetical protein [Bifidobacteriaceae bacterium]
MQAPTYLAESGLEQLTDFASFPNIEQIGVLLTLLVLIGVILLAAVLGGIKKLRASVDEAGRSLTQPGAVGPVLAVSAAAPAAAPPPAVVAAVAAASPQLAGPEAPRIEQPVSFAEVMAEPKEKPAAIPAAATPARGVDAAPGPRFTLPEEQATQKAIAASGALPNALNTAARREISLVGRALKILDELERSETDPDKLYSLFALDNLMARMRRGAESQMILGGRDPERAVRSTLSMSDVVRTASSQIEHYERIRIALDWDPFIRAYAVVPMAHLIAELLENAASFSPEGTAVEVGATNHSGDVVLTIADTGVGMSPQELATLNRIVQDGGNEEDLAQGRLGVAVVARLAARLGAAVSFAPSQAEDSQGTTVIVRVPSKLVDDRPAPPEDQPPAPATEGQPALPPQPQLDESAVQPPATRESFQPVQVAGAGANLPKRGAKAAPAGESNPAPSIPAAAIPATGATPQAEKPAAPAKAAPPAQPEPPAAKPQPAPGGAPEAKPQPPATGQADKPEGIVPLGARFSPLGTGANPAAALPRHALDAPADQTTPADQNKTAASASPPAGPPGKPPVAKPTTTSPGEGGKPPASGKAAAQPPFAGAPAVASQPAGLEPRSAGTAGSNPAGTAAAPGADAGIRRRPAIGRRPTVAAGPVAGAGAEAVPPPGGTGIPAPGQMGAAGTFQPGGPGAGTFQPVGGPAPSGVLPSRTPKPAAPTAPAEGGAFQPAGTMMPGGGGGNVGSSIAGSAIALKASIQEEALAELAGINAYRPERTESRPASSLARRESGKSALPAPAETTGPAKARDADKVRSALSAFQLGTRRGRSSSRGSAGKG